MLHVVVYDAYASLVAACVGQMGLQQAWLEVPVRHIQRKKWSVCGQVVTKVMQPANHPGSFGNDDRACTSSIHPSSIDHAPFGHHIEHVCLAQRTLSISGGSRPLPLPAGQKGLDHQDLNAMKDLNEHEAVQKREPSYCFMLIQTFHCNPRRIPFLD